jgi:hypothetical protein
MSPPEMMVIDGIKNKYESEKIPVGYIPMKAKTKAVTVLLNQSTGQVLKIIDIDPWK